MPEIVFLMENASDSFIILLPQDVLTNEHYRNLVSPTLYSSLSPNICMLNILREDL